jgi:hypothetical protein
VCGATQLAESGARPLRMVTPGGRVFWAWKRQMRLGVLPARWLPTPSPPRSHRVYACVPLTFDCPAAGTRSHFCNGHVYFVQKRPQQLGMRPYVVHPTFQIEGAVGKKSRFREAGLWMADADEYFTHGK